MIYPLAELMRDAKKGNMKLELTEWHGNTCEDLPERLRGVRPVVNAKSKALVILNSNGIESELRIEKASLVEYDKEILTVFDPGSRDLTEEERKLLADWQKKEEEFIKKNPYSEIYWQKVAFFKNSKLPYMSGHDMVRGKKYLSWENKVLDQSVRGKAILKYKVHFS